MDNCTFIFAGDLSAHDTLHIYCKAFNAFIKKFAMYFLIFKIPEFIDV